MALMLIELYPYGNLIKYTNKNVIFKNSISFDITEGLNKEYIMI